MLTTYDHLKWYPGLIAVVHVMNHVETPEEVSILLWVYVLLVLYTPLLSRYAVLVLGWLRYGWKDSRGFRSLEYSMIDDEFRTAVQQGFEECHESVDGEFTVDTTVEHNGVEMGVEVFGKHLNNPRWGEDSYAIDGEVSFTVDSVEDWDAFGEDLVKTLGKQIAGVLEDGLGYTGPVVPRSNMDESERLWARRLLFKEDDEDTDEA